MKHFIYLAVVFIFFGCTTKISKEDLSLLNGYWEISQVTFPNGRTKEFTVNPTIDYIELNGFEGFRKKVQPKFDGSFKTSDDAEYFIIKKNDANFQIHYSSNMALNPTMQRIESLVLLSKNSFTVIDQDTLTYTYKRFQPINTIK